MEKVDDLVARLEGMLQLAQGAPEGLVNKIRTLGQIIQMGRYQPKRVNRAPCQEVVLRGDEVDLFKFPILKCWPMDGGRYITLPLVITRDPVTGTQTMAPTGCRCTTPVLPVCRQTHKVGAHHYRVAQEQQDNRLEVAVAIGADPATMWTGLPPCHPTWTRWPSPGLSEKKAWTWSRPGPWTCWFRPRLR